ncbi:hypothetical protein LSH36_464g01027 [Paralvinella palmiformis]|uniref:Uncharacterized protein n=1 Tax=Paralvinella palmiformis TaxID=53620 RepID=A0AAD9MZW6_9ANNE|nr:hypothetical protein LSH36_464g01027 [Paralvinella palmiformis]
MDGLFWRIRDFDLNTLNPEIAARALSIIGKFRIDDITESSAKAALFYKWTTGMIAELYHTHPDARNATPANLKRQKEILDDQELRSIKEKNHHTNTYIHTHTI